ncbi:hypothetical protein [Lutibacter flavus]|uniref:Uncharacterized protein n=1 Tax=Lutibacter flavus TaxID=691689 RepID=A0A238Y5F9_9FLAO|nr:hypothetical protein [Lutibacter flavus]SNR66250.1 hypothetical protein SAMN04488111_2290 [Lutibacter flavus]
MKKKVTLQYVLILFFLIQSTTIYSQIHKPEHENYYKWFDAIIGVGNTGIYNGIEYEKKYRTLGESHEFYITSQFLNGDIVYDSQPYFNIEMKYDVFEDELIVKLPSQYGGSIIIKLIKEKIDSFNINNNRFVRIYIGDKEQISEINRSFYQVLYQSNYIKLYKKHRKTKLARSDKDFIYNVFKEQIESYIYYDKKYHQVKSKGDFLRLFPEQKKRINAFYKSNKVLRKSDNDKFLIELSKYIESLITFNDVPS